MDSTCTFTGVKRTSGEGDFTKLNSLSKVDSEEWIWQFFCY